MQVTNMGNQIRWEIITLQ